MVEARLDEEEVLLATQVGHCAASLDLGKVFRRNWGRRVWPGSTFPTLAIRAADVTPACFPTTSVPRIVIYMVPQSLEDSWQLPGSFSYQTPEN